MKVQWKKIALALACLGSLPAAAVVPGFAGNVTGGGNTTPVVVSTLSAAQTAVNNYSGSGGLVLHYNGTFDEQAILNNICGQWSKPAQELSISGKNNITILGIDGSKANFGIRIKGTSQNIIVRNMKIGLLPGGASNGDLIGIEANSRNVWIDHNELYTRNQKCEGTPDDDTTFDGMLDIKNSATLITVSYNYMHDHAKVGLIGASDTDSAERRVTYAHNRYENLGSRLPFQRFGYVHSYNNWFNNITGSGINPRMGGHVLIENNFFENALNPVFSQSTVLGQWDIRNNNTRSAADNATYNIRWTACSGSTPCQKATNWQTTATFPITLPYTYTTYTPAISKCIAINTAGAGKGLKEAADVLSTSCSATNNITLGAQTLQFSAGAASANVPVTSNVSWTVNDDQSWLSTTPTSGVDNGSFAVNVTANSGTSARNGTVTVTGGALTRTVSVAQTGQTVANYINLAPIEVSFPGSGGTAQVTLTSNVSWSITNSGGSTITPSSGTGNATLTITRGENPGYTGISANYTIAGGGVTANGVISQGPRTTGLMTVTPTALSLAATSSTGTFTVSANTTWTIAADPPSWLSVSPTSGSTGSATVTVTASANPGSSARTGTATVTGGGNTRTVSVTQAGQSSTSAVYQTESGAVGGGTVLESSNGGFNGTGYVNASTSGGFSQNTNVDGRGGGSKTLRIRYALGVSASRTGQLVVNGTTTNITFPSTGSWTTWQTQNVTVTLNNDSSNTIRFQSTGQDLANIDQVEVL